MVFSSVLLVQVEIARETSYHVSLVEIMPSPKGTFGCLVILPTRLSRSESFSESEMLLRD